MSGLTSVWTKLSDASSCTPGTTARAAGTPNADPAFVRYPLWGRVLYADRLVCGIGISGEDSGETLNLTFASVVTVSLSAPARSG